MKKWHIHGDNYTYEYPSDISDELPVGIYSLEHSIFGFYLKRISTRFKFPYKIYGTEKVLINRVTTAFENSTKNMGVLLNGIKGTGKTVTAKQICNCINLPIIVINKRFDETPNGYLSGIDQDFVLFVDEYEKIYQDSHELLTIMDGVLNSNKKRLFMLTTNELYINGNMLERPSRIRYLKTFDHLSPELVQEIVDDLLSNKQHMADTILFISTLKTITIDIVKAIVEEVNIFNEAPQDFQDIFNVKRISGKFNVYCADPKDKYNKLLLKEAATVYPNNVCDNHIGSDFTINDVHIGEIKEIVEKSSYSDSVTFKITFNNESELDDDDLEMLNTPNSELSAKDKKTKAELISEMDKTMNTNIKHIVNELNGQQQIMDYITDCIKRKATIVIYMEPAATSHDNYKYNTKYWQDNF